MWENLTAEDIRKIRDKADRENLLTHTPTFEEGIAGLEWTELFVAYLNQANALRLAQFATFLNDRDNFVYPEYFIEHFLGGLHKPRHHEGVWGGEIRQRIDELHNMEDQGVSRDERLPLMWAVVEQMGQEVNQERGSLHEWWAVFLGEVKRTAYPPTFDDEPSAVVIKVNFKDSIREESVDPNTLQQLIDAGSNLVIRAPSDFRGIPAGTYLDAPHNYVRWTGNEVEVDLGDVVDHNKQLWRNERTFFANLCQNNAGVYVPVFSAGDSSPYGAIALDWVAAAYGQSSINDMVGSIQKVGDQGISALMMSTRIKKSEKFCIKISDLQSHSRELIDFLWHEIKTNRAIYWNGQYVNPENYGRHS